MLARDLQQSHDIPVLQRGSGGFPRLGGGRIVLAGRPTGSAALVLNGLGEAEPGWAYQA